MDNFEASCVFDPAKDLGYFIAKLLATKKRYQLALDIRLQERFLEIYTAKIRSSSYKKGILERVDIYKVEAIYNFSIPDTVVIYILKIILVMKRIN